MLVYIYMGFVVLVGRRRRRRGWQKIRSFWIGFWWVALDPGNSQVLCEKRGEPFWGFLVISLYLRSLHLSPSRGFFSLLDKVERSSFFSVSVYIRTDSGEKIVDSWQFLSEGEEFERWCVKFWWNSFFCHCFSLIYCKVRSTVPKQICGVRDCFLLIVLSLHY